jgi:protein SCO1/2
VWISSFFYASCPGPCWQLNQALNGVQDEFKNTDLKLVSITCDPKTDSPEVLRRYADRFKADSQRWIFLTGDLAYIKRIGRDIFFQDVKEGQHRNSALVIDRNGKISNSFDLLDSAEVTKMKVLLKKLLEEKPSAENADVPGATTDEVKLSG